MKGKICIVLFMIFLLTLSGCIENSPNQKSKTVFVDINGNGDYVKIQEAIENVSKGYTILVSQGTYYEKIVIDRSIKLISENKEKPIITYPSKEDPNDDNVISIRSDGCTVNGFKINCEKPDKNFIGININSTDNIIQNNIISCSYKSIYISEVSSNNLILDNIVINSTYGIEIDQSEGNEISKNDIINCKEIGIYLYGAEKNIVSENNISKNNFGIQAKGADNNEIFKNYINKNQIGIFLCCLAKYNVVYSNNFVENNNSALDEYNNEWDNGKSGNYWDDYINKYPEAEKIDGYWNIPYNITSIAESKVDRFPLVNPV